MSKFDCIKTSCKGNKYHEQFQKADEFGNHTHIFDSLLLISTTKRSIHFLAKNELWKGSKKIIFSNLGLIPVNRKAKDHKALESAINYLNNDKLIGIFPEGTTEKGKGMLPFKIGAIKMAKETNSKILQ